MGVKMKAIVIEEFGGSEKIHFKDVPKPKISEHEVLIQCACAGVNPSDWMIREGLLKDYIPHEFPLILGMDVSGTVVDAGKSVKELKIGDEVFCYSKKPIVKWGTFAEYTAVDAKFAAKKPKNLTFAEAAALPMVSLTAWQSLFNAGHIKKGETIFIQGASGGVGSMAVQLAKYTQAEVIATASLKKHHYVKQMGADLVIDYRDNVKEKVRAVAPNGVDLVFDCVGGAVFRESLSLLKKGGRIVSVLEQLDPEEAKKLGIHAKIVFTAPNGQELSQIAHLVEEKKLRPPHIEEMSWKEAAQALDKIRSGAVLGKIVLQIEKL